MYYTYILISLNFPKTYVGRTIDLDKRVKEHNQGMSNFTRRFKQWKLLSFETFTSWEDSTKREKYFKSAAGRR